MRQVTLGGDRLGAGKRQKVSLKSYERSTHNLGYIWRSTMSAGTLVPFMKIPALPGDTFDITLNADVKTHPTVGPLFGSFKLQLDVFLAAIRLYQGQLHNNKLGIGLNMDTVKLPILTLPANPIDNGAWEAGQIELDNTQINPSCIFAYLGIRGVGNTGSSPIPVARDFNGVPYLMYWDIYKNYYANKQEEIGAVIHTPPTTLQENVSGMELVDPLTNSVAITEYPTLTPMFTGSGYWIQLVEVAATTQPLDQVLISFTDLTLTLEQFGIATRIDVNTVRIDYDWARWGNRTIQSWQYVNPATLPQGAIQIETFPLENLDNMRERILENALQSTPFDIIATGLSPYELPLESQDNFRSMMQSQEGLALKTYNSDLFNNWLQTEWIDDINQRTAIDTTGDEFSIDQLVLAKKVWELLNRVAVSGGSYDDWTVAVYDHEPFARSETPMYMGGLIKEVVFQEVVSNAEATADGTQPLGTLAGKGTMSNKHKGGRIHAKVDEMSYLMGIVSLTPRVDYSQGNEWDTHLLTMDDFHKPQLDGIGFQDLITEQMAWWNTHYSGVPGIWTTRSAGKQTAWINYQTAVNKVLGNFAIADNEMFMTLNRKYTPEFSSPYYLIGDLTTYIDPAKYNSIFAQTSLDSQNFWVQISVDIDARRKMSANQIPNL